MGASGAVFFAQNQIFSPPGLRITATQQGTRPGQSV